MGIGYDLHIHSVFSDGTLLPEEIVEQAVWKKLDGIALTDHDTVNGVISFLEVAEKKGIKAIQGIEVSCAYKGKDIHILGYNYNIDAMSSNKKLKKVSDSRMPRVFEMIDRMHKDGINISREDILSKNIKGQLGRPHIARILMEKGIVSSWDEAFMYYLSEDSKYYIPKYNLPVEEGIEIILSSGGIPVIAHPGLYRVMPSIEELVEWGIQGIEVYYPLHSDYDRERFLSWCRRYALYATGGSDFHGIESKPPLGSTVVREYPF